MYIIPEFNNSRSRNNRIETYRGRIKTLKDALLVLEGSRLGLLPQIKRRLNGVERQSIKPNTIFAWNETECGMKRWTDGKNWSASKVAGPFLVYREFTTDKKVKKGGLTKQSFSLTTKQGTKLHLISYFSTDEDATKSDDEAKDLGPTDVQASTTTTKGANKLYPSTQPSKDPLLKDLTLDSSIYQEFLLYYDQYSNNNSEDTTNTPTLQLTPNLHNVFSSVPETSSRPPLIAHKTNSYPQLIQQVQQLKQFQQNLQQHAPHQQLFQQLLLLHFHRQQNLPATSNQKVMSISRPGSLNNPSPQPSHLSARTSLVPPILYQPLIYPPPPPVPTTSSSTPSSSAPSNSYYHPTPSDSHGVPTPLPSSYTISTGYYNYLAQHPLPQYYHPPSGQALLAGVYHYPLEAPRIYHSNVSHNKGTTSTLNSANVSAGSSPNQTSSQQPKREDSETIKMLDKSFSFK